MRGRAIRLATMGCFAFALDYQGGGKMVSDREEAMARLGVLMGDRALTLRYARAGLDQLLQQEQADPDRLAVTGFCFGGAMALEMAREGVELKAVVGFHAGLPPADVILTRRIKGRVLVCLGDADPFVAPRFEPHSRRSYGRPACRAGGSTSTAALDTASPT